MTIAAARHLAVPTGTSAATVIAREPSPDPAIESRRFARLAALSEIAFRAQFEELVVSGVYTVLQGRLLVVRVIKGSERRFAVVGEDLSSTPPVAPRAGLHLEHRLVVVADESAAASGLQGIVESEARQRPIFHGVTPDGSTYSGFGVLHAEPLLAALREAMAPRGGAPAAGSGGITVFALGSDLELPAGLVVGLERAPA